MDGESLPQKTQLPPEGWKDGGVEPEGQALGSEAPPWARLVTDAAGSQSGQALMGPMGKFPPQFTGAG